MKLIAKITSYPRLMDICDNNKSDGGEIMPCKALQEMFDEQQKIGRNNSTIQAIQNKLITVFNLTVMSFIHILHSNDYFAILIWYKKTFRSTS